MIEPILQKNTGTILKKAIAAVIASAFLFNDIAFAGDFQNLARPGLQIPEVMERMEGAYNLLSAEKNGMRGHELFHADPAQQMAEELTLESFNRFVTKHEGLVSLEGISRHFGLDKRFGRKLSDVKRALEKTLDIEAVINAARQSKKTPIPIIVHREMRRNRLKKIIDFMKKSPGAVTLKEIARAIGVRARVGLNMTDIFGRAKGLCWISGMEQFFNDLNHNQRLFGKAEIAVVDVYDRAAAGNRLKVVAAIESLNGIASAEELAAAIGMKTDNPKSAVTMANRMFRELDMNAINQERKAHGAFPFYHKLINNRTKKSWNAILAHVEGRAGVSTVHEIALDLSWSQANVYGLIRSIDWDYINTVRKAKGLFPLEVFYRTKPGDARKNKPLRVARNGLTGIKKGDDIHDILMQARRYFKGQHGTVGYRSYRLFTVPRVYTRFREVFSTKKDYYDRDGALYFLQEVLTLIVNNTPDGKAPIRSRGSGIMPRKDLINYYFQVDIPRAINISGNAFNALNVKAFEENLRRVLAHDFPLKEIALPELSMPSSDEKGAHRRPMLPNAKIAGAKRTGDGRGPRDDISPNRGATGYGKDPLKVSRGAPAAADSYASTESMAATGKTDRELLSEAQTHFAEKISSSPPDNSKEIPPKKDVSTATGYEKDLVDIRREAEDIASRADEISRNILSGTTTFVNEEAEIEKLMANFNRLRARISNILADLDNKNRTDSVLAIIDRIEGRMGKIMKDALMPLISALRCAVPPEAAVKKTDKPIAKRKTSPKAERSAAMTASISKIQLRKQRFAGYAEDSKDQLSPAAGFIVRLYYFDDKTIGEMEEALGKGGTIIRAMLTKINRHLDEGRSGVGDAADFTDVDFALTEKIVSPGFGERMRKIRKMLDLSRDELSLMLDMIKHTLWAWEKGKSLPHSYNKIANFAAKTGIPLEYILKGEKADIAFANVRARAVDRAYTQIKEADAPEKVYTIKAWEGYAAPSQKSFLTEIRKLMQDKQYRVSFDEIGELVSFACNNINDSAVTILPLNMLDVDQIAALRNTDARVIYINLEGQYVASDGLTNLQGLIGTGKAYLSDDEESFYRLYGLLAREPVAERIALFKLKNNPVLFIERLKFILKPITVEDPQELYRVRKIMETLLRDA